VAPRVPNLFRDCLFLIVILLLFDLKLLYWPLNKNKMNSKHIVSTTVNKELYDFLGQISEKESMSRSTWMRRLIAREKGKLGVGQQSIFN
jgi:hypothetical protein